jgi:hypothetical protein
MDNIVSIAGVATKAVSQRIGNIRLRKLAEFLQTIPEENFNYGIWSRELRPMWQSKEFIKLLQLPKLTTYKLKVGLNQVVRKVFGKDKSYNTCGTTGCAMGWAASMPYFNKLGLRLSLGGNPGTKNHGHPLLAAQEIFGITPEEAHFLFVPGALNPHKITTQSPGERAAAKTVAKHILKFVEEREKRNECGAVK